MTELPEEPNKNWRLSDEILNVWSKSGGAAYQAAAREITLSRVHIKRLQSNLDATLAMSKNSVEREGKVWDEVNRLREGLHTILGAAAGIILMVILLMFIFAVLLLVVAL
jgi:hypothetical protein